MIAPVVLDLDGRINVNTAGNILLDARPTFPLLSQTTASNQGWGHWEVKPVKLSSIIATMGYWFDWLRLAGAAYLVWLGFKLIRSSGDLDRLGRTAKPRGGFVLQGFLVLLGNTKALLWFGAFIPQFIDPTSDYVRQVILLGLTAMACAALSDGGYAVLAGGARNLMSKSRVRLVSRIGGVCLMGGGVWLALARAR